MPDFFHRLDASGDAGFLEGDHCDPFTGVPFRAGNTVVRAADGTVMLRESWEALGGVYRGSSKTLPWKGSAPKTTPADDASEGRPRTNAAALAAAAESSREPPLQASLQASLRRASAPESEERSSGRSMLPLVAGAAALLGLLLVAAWLIRFSGSSETAEMPPDTTAAEVDDAETLPLTADEEIDGALEEGDAETSDGRLQDRFALEADSSGRILRFVLASDDFLPDLYVETPDGQRIEAEAADEDGREMEVTDLRGPGAYRVFVSSREPAGRGRYGLRIETSTPVRALPAGQNVEHELGEFSERADGRWRDTYDVRAVAGREHTLTITSATFTPEVRLVRGSEAVSTNSESVPNGIALTFTPQSDGTLRLTITSEKRRATGDYRVRLDVEEAPEPVTLRANAAPTRDSLAAGQTLLYQFEGRTGDRILLDVRASDFTPRVEIVAPNERRFAAETEGGRARLRQTLSIEGAYRVEVTGGEGPVTLLLEQTAAPAADEVPRLPGANRPAPESRQGGDSGVQEGESEGTENDAPADAYRPQPLGDTSL